MISGLKTDIGSGSRGKGNEDNLIVLKIQVEKGPSHGEYHLLAVADGMGGLEKGELASSLAIKGITKTLLNKLVSDKSYFSEKEQPLEPAQILKESIEVANLLVYNVSKRDKNSEMGSTIVAGLIKNGKLFVAHVGDSRAYLIRRNSIERLTTDHSLVQALYESHLINTGEIYEHPHKNIITRSIGFSPKVEVEINEKRKGNPVTLQNKDFILMCSDGLSNVLEEEEILHMVKTKNYNPQVIANELINLANRRGTDDNATILCSLIQEEDLLPSTSDTKIKPPVELKRLQTKIPTVTLSPPIINCPHCNHKNILGDLTCNACGKPHLFISGKARIIIVDGPDSGKRIDINKDEVTIGREQDINDMFITEPAGREFISRKHIKIFKRGDDYWIEDLKSTNGTKIRGVQIRGKQLKLQNGELIIIGMNTLEFKI